MDEFHQDLLPVEERASNEHVSTRRDTLVFECGSGLMRREAGRLRKLSYAGAAKMDNKV